MVAPSTLIMLGTTSPCNRRRWSSDAYKVTWNLNVTDIHNEWPWGTYLRLKPWIITPVRWLDAFHACYYTLTIYWYMLFAHPQESPCSQTKTWWDWLVAEPWCQYRNRIANERHVHDNSISSFWSVIGFPVAQSQGPCGLYSSVAFGLLALTLRLSLAFEGSAWGTCLGVVEEQIGATKMTL